MAKIVGSDDRYRKVICCRDNLYHDCNHKSLKRFIGPNVPPIVCCHKGIHLSTMPISEYKGLFDFLGHISCEKISCKHSHKNTIIVAVNKEKFVKVTDAEVDERGTLEATQDNEFKTFYEFKKKYSSLKQFDLERMMLIRSIQLADYNPEQYQIQLQDIKTELNSLEIHQDTAELATIIKRPLETKLTNASEALDSMFERFSKLIVETDRFCSDLTLPPYDLLLSLDANSDLAKDIVNQFGQYLKTTKEKSRPLVQKVDNYKMDYKTKLNFDKLNHELNEIKTQLTRLPRRLRSSPSINPVTNLESECDICNDKSRLYICPCGKTYCVSCLEQAIVSGLRKPFYNQTAPMKSKDRSEHSQRRLTMQCLCYDKCNIYWSLDGIFGAFAETLISSLAIGFEIETHVAIAEAKTTWIKESQLGQLKQTILESHIPLACNRCHFVFDFSGGCMDFTCQKCRHTFCGVCLQNKHVAVYGYNRETFKCGLWKGLNDKIDALPELKCTDELGWRHWHARFRLAKILDASKNLLKDGEFTKELTAFIVELVNNKVKTIDKSQHFTLPLPTLIKHLEMDETLKSNYDYLEALSIIKRGDKLSTLTPSPDGD